MPPADPADALRARVAAARPEVDPFTSRVIAASVAAALFGADRAVTVGRYQLRRVLGSGGGGSVFVAHDPELDRELAVKLVIADDADRRARAVAEGQALARLAHPHVVAVFDVGVVEDRVFLAMELVRGQPLRTFAPTATPREVLRAYREAGAGLVAAHTAGLVHGDFKPDNAVIGADGRVRVVDFGLAGTVGADVAGGTPQYMAPELRDDATASPAIDQFAFAVALRESLAAAGWSTLPRWLDAIATRGAAPKPADRFPTLAALLAALADDPRTRWRRRGLVAAPIVLAAVGFALGRGGDNPAAGPRCDDAAAAMGTAWNPARRASMIAHLQSLRTSFAATTADGAADGLDRYAAAWGQAHVAACRVRDRELPALGARRASCLAQARARLDAVAELFETAAVADVADAVRAASELPPIERCQADDIAVDAVAPPPIDQAAAVAAASAALDRASARVIAVRPDAIDATAAVLAEARRLGYAPLVATALLWHGRALQELGRPREARAPLDEAVSTAIAGRVDAVAVEAFARGLLPAVPEDYARATGAMRAIAALATRLDPRDRFAVALLDNHAGVIERASGHVDAARAAWTRALALARDVDGPGAVELAWVRTNLAGVTADPATRATLRAEALAVTRTRLGADHPLTLDLEMAAAFGASTPDAARAALRGPCTRAAELHPGRGAEVVACAYELAILDLSAGALDDARASLALVLRPTLGGELDRDRLAIAHALAAQLRGDRTAATELDALAAQLAPTDATPWFRRLLIADVELGRALAGDRRATARAIAQLERASTDEPGPVIARRLAWARALAAR